MQIIIIIIISTIVVVITLHVAYRRTAKIVVVVWSFCRMYYEPETNKSSSNRLTGAATTAAVRQTPGSYSTFHLIGPGPSNTTTTKATESSAILSRLLTPTAAATVTLPVDNALLAGQPTVFVYPTGERN